MALLGRGAFAAWHDVAEGREAEYDRWQSHEHMAERVGIQGFLRGRRYAAAEAGGPRYFILYETADLGVLTSPAYLERLDNPTAWTREVMPTLRGMNRTLCRVAASSGRGVGHAAQSVRLSPRAGASERLGDLLRAELERWAGSPGLVGCSYDAGRAVPTGIVSLSGSAAAGRRSGPCRRRCGRRTWRPPGRPRW